MRTRLRHELTAAIKARDLTATRALRSALSAIENAEATEVIHDPQVATGSQHIAASTAGLGAAEVERRVLSHSEVHALVQAQVDERLLAAEEYESLRRGDLAGQLRAEADVLGQYLDPSQEGTLTEFGNASSSRTTISRSRPWVPNPRRSSRAAWSSSMV